MEMFGMHRSSWIPLFDMLLHIGAHFVLGFGFVTFTEEAPVEALVGKRFVEINKKSVEIKAAMPKSSMENGPRGPRTGRSTRQAYPYSYAGQDYAPYGAQVNQQYYNRQQYQQVQYPGQQGYGNHAAYGARGSQGYSGADGQQYYGYAQRANFAQQGGSSAGYSQGGTQDGTGTYTPATSMASQQPQGGYYSGFQQGYGGRNGPQSGQYQQMPGYGASVAYGAGGEFEASSLHGGAYAGAGAGAAGDAKDGSGDPGATGGNDDALFGNYGSAKNEDGKKIF